MKWEWLRVGRRIEWVMGGIFVFACLMFGSFGLSSHDLFVEIVLSILGGLTSLTMIVPAYLIVARRRRREAAGVFQEPKARLSTRGRLRFYLLLVLLTLVSSEVQAAHGMASLAGSVQGVYLWNLGLFGVVILWNELSLWLRNKRRAPQQTP